jgi:pilus assembly protein CpaC
MAYRILTAAAVFVALAAPALADDIRPNGPPLVLKPGAGTLLEAPVPLGNVFIASSDIANVQAYPMEGGKNLVYVYAKKPGTTSLYALDESGHVALNRIVEVQGPRTVLVLRGPKREVWSEAPSSEPTLADLPAGSTVSIPAGGQR